MTDREFLSCFLFVPADRPERFGKAASSGADAVIVDLEDAVAADAKSRARDRLAQAGDEIAGSGIPLFVRVNAVGSEWIGEDIDALSGVKGLSGVILPKAEHPPDLLAIRERLPDGGEIFALIETAAGLAHARELAGVATRLAFGSIDFANDIGAAHTRDALLSARSELVLASRLAGIDAPLDGVTADFRDSDCVEADTRYASGLGFSGKLLIHPAQIGPARAGFAPSEDDIRWARRILSQASSAGAIAVDGAMVDAPVLKRAEWILSHKPKGK